MWRHSGLPESVTSQPVDIPDRDRSQISARNRWTRGYQAGPPFHLLKSERDAVAFTPFGAYLQFHCCGVRNLVGDVELHCKAHTTGRRADPHRVKFLSSDHDLDRVSQCVLGFDRNGKSVRRRRLERAKTVHQLEGHGRGHGCTVDQDLQARRRGHDGNRYRLQTRNQDE